ncbi:hypothetical protein HHK36_032146 [Tetracentron sinense]|uniref:UBC core domain-containing protein n=1 Tax=Tetracentron sinense TaxID=13715 RepID=A0A834Y602_TETSI|nr:hypothetical protein HHK36_032146 [Tetracentron sinense]
MIFIHCGQENIFEWQFAIRGPCDTEFEGGIYHGRIQLPAEYPFQPPAFMLLTPNGRFETQTKICLSISNHHPEHWQPSWSVRTALVALIAFMPTNPDGALGSLDYKKEERHALAIKSRETAPIFGTPERQNLIDEIHHYMLSKAPQVPQLSSPQTSEEHSTNQEDEAQVSPQNAGVIAAGEDAVEHANPGDNRIQEVAHEVRVNANAGRLRVSFSAGVRMSSQMPADEQMQEAKVQKPANDRLFTWAAIGLTFAIVILLLKKFLKSSGQGAGYMDGF